METQFEHTSIPIAIVGMACRVPGADDLEQFWQMLSSGGCAVAELPHERLDQELYYDPRRGQRGKTYAKLGAIISSRQFDRQACPIAPSLERAVDNAHLLMCQTAGEALRHGGLDPFNLPLRNAGVFIGHAQGSNLAGDFTYGTCIEEGAQFLREVPGFDQLPQEDQESIIRDLVETVRGQTPQRTADSPDVAINMVAGTISKAFGLNGPFAGVNSACASSLQSVMMGVRALQLGHIDMAIVGGASDCKSDSLVLFSHAQSMSETGTRPFDANADGLICSEGYVCLVLKTLPRALADGDRIQAIIRGAGMSSDGRGKSLWAPRREGQVKAMERAYRHGLEMSTLQYIEAHATSTNLGDATELNALAEVLGNCFPPGKKIPITSVKANIGHALEAAGVSSVIKSVLCLQHRTFVPAININSLNSKIDWDKAPFYIPQQLTPWPEQPNGLPRRAAVNAFGIGGLNVHLVVEEFSEDRRAALCSEYLRDGRPKGLPRPKSADGEEEAVAVIGMGCIFPGADHPTKFWELISSGRDPKGTTPPGRWRADLSYEPGSRRPYRTPATRGGYITDFAYDWRKHKEPPKQVQQADPLQFMFLTAADQALHDAGYDKKDFDRTRVGVLVGTEFGGDFSTQLEVGLRLPHIEKILKESFAKRGYAPEDGARLAAEYSNTLLKHWPALVDESGSFSTSTLASRITKTMNLMGGAAAIDASDTSSAATLSACVDILLSGDCDMMICAGGQRCMNLPQFEGMAASGILATDDNPRAPFDANARGMVPGEGVGVLLLKRLSEARRDGDKIHAIVRGIGAGHTASAAESMQLAMQRAFETARVDPADVALVELDGTGLPDTDQEQLRALVAGYGREQRSEPLLVSTITGQIGHTIGASAMASFIKASLEVENGAVPRTFGLETPLPVVAENPSVLQAATQSTPIRHTTRDGRRLAAVSSWGKGQAYHILLERGQKVPVSAAAATPAAQQRVAASVAPVSPAAAPASASAAGMRIYHVGGATAAEVAAKLEAAQANPAAAFAQAEHTRFIPTDRARLAIVAASAEALAKKLQLAAKQFANPDARTVLEQQGCFYRTVPVRKPRVAFLFPGQGSHYAGMLRELVRDVPAAADAMRRIDAVMVQRGYQTFAQMAWENTAQLGSDVWVTQVVMLLADVIVNAAIADLGITPDLVAGHSYGEFAALTAADAWDLEGVVTAARARYDAIEATPTARGTLMATTAPPHVIEPTAATLAERTYLANFNAPDQTVVGGSPAALAQLSEKLNAAGYKSQVLSVPCPYHTPLLEGAGSLLKRTLDTLRMRPPRVPLLSSVTNRYVAEPEDIRANLAAQLTTPVRYVELIQRIAQEQDTVFVEVGPQQALTKLNRRILDGENMVGVIACDNAKQPGVEQLHGVKALLECLGVIGEPVAAVATTAPPATAVAGPPPSAPSQPAAARPAPAPAPRSPQPAMTTPQRGTITHFDATQRRVEKMKQLAAGGPKASNGHHAPVGNGSPGTNGGNGSAPVLNGGAAHAAAPPAAVRSVATPPPRTSAPVAAAVAPARPQASAPVVAAAAVAEKTASGGLNPAELEKFLINFVVEQTGYPPEVVELDVDLEADLGIDSIKKAQLFGELAEYFDVQPNENMTLDDFPTLRHVMNFLAAAPMKNGAPAAGAPLAASPVVAAQPQAEVVAKTASSAIEKSASGGLNPAELEKFMINFVVEQTGYPPEVVELDADLEADLGIDSIKKAQLFGELAEYFDVQPNENMTLDDFPTLRHVVNFLAAAPMKGDLPQTAAATSPAPVAAQAPTVASPTAPVAAPAAPAGPGLNPAELEKFMINFVVEQTGYPPEVVELDADLEADLGIDSIKKAQLFGELAEYFDVQPNENMTLDDFPTLRHVVNFLAAAPMKGDLPATASAPVASAGVASGPVASAVAPAPAMVQPQAVAAASAVAPASAAPASPGLNPAELESFLINFVVEQTGYPPEVVELDADLEADLGIDSIKKAQLFGELAEYFDVKPDENLTLDDFPTLRHVMDFLANSGLKKNSIASENRAAEVQESPAPSHAGPVATVAPDVGPATQAALSGEQRAAIRALLHARADQADGAAQASPPAAFSAEELAHLQGIARAVGISPSGVVAHGREVLSLLKGAAFVSRPAAPPVELAPEPISAGPPYDLSPEDYQSDATHRFILRELELPFEPTAAAMPTWHGAALIVGEHPLGDALARQLESAGVPVRRLPISADLDETLVAFERIWDEQPTPHVFIVTGREPEADSRDEAAWRNRWYRAAILPYFLCQRWVQRAGDARLLDKCSLVAATNLNGTLGFSGRITSPECGALTGLMKAVYIEVAIMREQRSMRAKAVDAPADEPLDSLAANICRELGSREVDYEVAFVRGQRYVQCAYPVKAPTGELAEVRPGGTWVVTGGARGITAECARELGRRFGLKLHLIGTSALREVDPSWRNLSPEGMKSLKATVMREARATGQSMEAEWNRVQRDIEIDRSLRALHDAGVSYVYHACDVADADALAAVLDEVRRVSGPIEGVIHGAGIERSASYERKSRESVLATLGAKVDGAVNLMRLTERDPIKWFIGFGSISGRLGSNGQTDYCLASDMLCKLMAWYRASRPGVRAVGFHWHAWDEVGMAARPESASAMKLADGPTTMPKREGLDHLVREIYAGAPEGEVLVTSWEYHGRFYGAEYHPRPDGTVPEPGSVALSSNTGQAAAASSWEPWAFAPLVSRHEMRMAEAPLPADSPAQPVWQGSACILGHNEAAQALREALQAAGVRVHMLPDSENPAETMAAMEAVYAADPPSYLFVMSGRDAARPALWERDHWQHARARGVNVPFLTTHHWFRLRVKAKDKRPVTIVAATSMGGDFGLVAGVPSPEGGALCGMLKTIYIEDSRQTPSQARVKAIDLPADESAAGVVEAIFRELASDDPNIEIGWSRGKRRLLQTFARPVESFPHRQAPRGGNWVITGGARGITAAVAFELGKRYGMKLHLVGRSPAPIANAPWRNCGEQQLNKIKSEIVRKAINESRSPEKEWERVKIDIEIHDTLNKFAAAGVHAVYHQCDLGNWDQLEAVLAEIRRQDGPITGIVHGAGWANSGRFGMRNPDYYERTMSGKLDGAVALMSLTRQDPVQYFIGFGSIGGRYGSNGLADYAAANDMLAKLCDWYRAQRTDTAVCCFHWQSWDEVGMAMLGDSSVGTKGILKMAFIPPREGVEHLCRELEAGLPTTEVLITDRFFEKTFYPFVQSEESAAAVASGAGDLSQMPLVEHVAPFDGSIEATITFDPKVDPFLLDHQFRGRGLLPAVIGLESVAEAARLASGKRVVAIRDLELIEGLLFHTDQKLEARIRTSAATDGAIACELVSDFYNRSHKLIKKDRLHLKAVAEVADAAAPLAEVMPEPPASMHAFEFQHNGPLYHGPALHGVKATTFDEHGGWGQLSALSLAKLGGLRPGRDWTVPATLLDAGFYVCGIHAWFLANQSFSLPASLERVQFARMPREDEPCWMTFRCREMSEKQAIYDFTVFGHDRSPVMQVTGHRLVMIRS